MPSSTIRRQMKNVVNNYSEAEKKVREATSNDPWGPSSSLMSEISDLTYNVVAFSEIMSMIWKRLNDHGKNWRHVYKALTLLDYLIKTGSERVALQCKENIFAIQTLKDFQYVDRDGKDQGINVREKSKQLVVLLKDDDRLKGERSQALKTKERMAQVATSVGSSHQIGFGRGSSQPNLSTSYSEEYGRSEGSPASYHGSTSPNASSELEQARPQTSGEEELQLQLALAMSREAAEQEERMRRGDDLRLQMALEESRKDTSKVPKKKKEPQSSLMDLMDAVSGGPVDPWGTGGGGAAAAAASAPSSDPWQSYSKPGSATKPAAPVDPWGLPASAVSVSPVKNSDPWGSSSAPAVADPWGSGPAARPKAPGPGSFDLFSTSNGTSTDDLEDFDSLRSSMMSGGGKGNSALSAQTSMSVSPDLFDLQPSATTRKTPESFLGPNAALVNLDSLITKPAQPAPVSNPFLAGGAAPAPPPQVNPFQVNQPQPPTLNQMRVSPMMGLSAQGYGNLAQRSNEPMPLSSLPPAGVVGMGPIGGMTPIAPMGQMMPSMGMPVSMSVPQPLRSDVLPPAGTTTQATGPTNPFLL
ncbi:epsin-2 [Tachysurus fulvidraco]|uniref:epsin-2 n=1 Tax=Tachysurus fulvidraco TaxID=1234273 RepID=UPI001FF0007D|nr:epsin-2 [Tachysurus fulvidraco]XP_027004236.2 epsin-2 [Tachysurus fulvidraco]XP_047663798.1 epsin-2 [Tachysurus fulvidraco]XP_047663799.1 epsin-2 [Tachysurus fulvidraco]